MIDRGIKGLLNTKRINGYFKILKTYMLYGLPSANPL